METKHFTIETEHFKIETEHFNMETEHFKIETENFKIEADHLNIEALRLELKPCVSIASPASQFEAPRLNLNLYVSNYVIPKSKSPFPSEARCGTAELKWTTAPGRALEAKRARGRNAAYVTPANKKPRGRR